MFHVTPSTNLGSIIVDGLVPDRGPRAGDLGEENAVVYLFATLDDLMDSHWLAEEFPDDDLVVLQVDTVGLSTTGTFGEDSWERVVTETITPDRLTIRDDILI